MKDEGSSLFTEEAIDECLSVARAKNYATALVRIRLRERSDSHEERYAPPFSLALLHPDEPLENGDVVLIPADGMEIRLSLDVEKVLRGWQVHFAVQSDCSGFHFRNLAETAELVEKIDASSDRLKAVP